MLRDARREAYEAKVRAEVAGLAARGVRMGGNAFSAVLLVGGGCADGEPFPAAVRTALTASLDRLGYAPEDWEWLIACDEAGGALEPALIACAIAALDPATVILADERAAAAVRDAYADELAVLEDFSAAALAPGALAHVRGMRILSLGDFAGALAAEDAAAKQRAWSWLKQLQALGEPY